MSLGALSPPHARRLLVGLFSFLRPYLSAMELSAATRSLYRGALRVLLVLLHDFPEFLCDYHFGLCEVIPPACIQMRNLVLSAFPRNMRLPDPFTPNLKVDLLPEISQPPRVLSLITPPLAAADLLADIDSFLATRQPLSLLLDLRTRVTTADGLPRTALLNALVLHVGTAGIAAQHALQHQQAQQQALLHSAPMAIYQRLLTDLTSEARYVLLNGIANQLRFPNNHTHYFSCVMLTLFAEAADEAMQEEITRVLVERLIVHRPHPWGLLITFIELIKNPRYAFWSKNFTRCAPEIERLFESVARSCMAPGSGGPTIALAQAAVDTEG
jgi:CCR4-NOT transcription complex subunit 1